jgi:hypothetical protein
MTPDRERGNLDQSRPRRRTAEERFGFEENPNIWGVSMSTHNILCFSVGDASASQKGTRLESATVESGLSRSGGNDRHKKVPKGCARSIRLMSRNRGLRQKFAQAEICDELSLDWCNRVVDCA